MFTSPIFLLGLGVLLFNVEGDPEAGAGAGGADPTNQTNQTHPASFTQADLDRIAGERAARARRALLSELGVEDPAEAARLLKEARSLQEQQEAARLKALEDQGRYKELEQEIRAKKDAEIRELTEKLTARERREQELVLTSSLERLAARAVKPEQAAALIRAEGAIRYAEDGTLYVADKSGKQALDDRGNAVSLDAYVQGWFANNPHHLPASGNAAQQAGGAQGGGSKTAIPGQGPRFDLAQRSSVNHIRATLEDAKRVAAERTKKG